MNIFKQTIKENVKEKDASADAVIAFSHRLKKTMKLSEEDIANAYACCVSWDVGKYRIKPQNFCWNGWSTILYASFMGEIPESWINVSGGTDLRLCPDVETQNEILQQIKIMLTN